MTEKSDRLQMRRKDYIDLKTGQRVSLMLLPDEYTTRQTLTIMAGSRIVARIHTDAVEMAAFFKE